MKSKDAQKLIIKDVFSYLKYLVISVVMVLLVVYIIATIIFNYVGWPTFSFLSFFSTGAVAASVVLGLLIVPSAMNQFVKLGVTRKDVFYGVVKGWIINILILIGLGILISMIVNFVIQPESIEQTYFAEIIPANDTMNQAEYAALYGDSMLAIFNRNLIMFVQISLSALSLFSLASFVGMSFYRGWKFALVAIPLAILFIIPENTFWGQNGYQFAPNVDAISNSLLAWIIGLIIAIFTILIGFTLTRWVSKDVRIRY